MKHVNLNEIFEGKAFYNNCLYDLNENEKQCVIDIMREACEQTVELCAEIDKKTIYKKGKWFNEVDSILNTKTQIV